MSRAGRPLAATEGRSRIMRAIRGTGNRSTELRLARVLRRARISGWRRHQRILGTPDFLWRANHVALFVDGCFWHGCPRCYRPPARNSAFWRQKIRYNRERDEVVTRELRRAGWTVLRIWECQVEHRSTLNRIHAALRDDRVPPLVARNLRR